jgi:hypothetical protein
MRRPISAAVVAALACILAATPALGVSWGPIVALTTTNDALGWPNGISVSGNYVHVVYRKLDPGGRIVAYRRSLNGGDTWQAPVELSRPAAAESTRPAIYVSGANVDVVWVEGNTLTGPSAVWYRHSSNNGGTWSASLRLSPTATFSVGFPVVLRVNPNVYVMYTDQETGQVFVRRSQTGGGTWGSRTVVGTTTNQTFGAAFDGLPSLAAGTSVVYVAWLLSSATVRARSTTNGGTTWNVPVTLDTHASGFAPHVAASGSLVAVAYTFFDGSVNSYAALRRSTDKGLHWVARQRVSAGTYPADGEAIIRANGMWRIVYNQCNDNSCSASTSLWYRESVYGGATWTGTTRFTALTRPDVISMGLGYSATKLRTVLAWPAANSGASSGDIYIRTAS